MHFLPHNDIILYGCRNMRDTYYQVGPLLKEEQKRQDEMPRKNCFREYGSRYKFSLMKLVDYKRSITTIQRRNDYAIQI